MVDSFAAVSSLNPTALCNFTLTVSKDPQEAPVRTFTAAIQDQGGRQKWMSSGEVQAYLSEADFDALETIVETLFEKAKAEMIP